MPAWGWAGVVWGASLPAAFVYARRQGFIAGDEPVVVFRVPIVAFVAPALALVAALAVLASLLARGRRS